MTAATVDGRIQRSLHDGPVRRDGDLDDADRLFRRLRERSDIRARDALFEQFLPLARRLATRYRGPNEPYEDLVQVAGVGLLGAIDRFDPDRGIPFRSFAIPTIIGELKRHFRNTGWSAHVSRRDQELALRVERATRELSGRRGGVPGPAELAQYLELDLHDVLVGVDANLAHFSNSLDAPVGTADDEPTPMGELIGRDEDGYDLVDAKLSLTRAISQLPYRERTALTLRVERDLKQSEIARRMGCSQMQVSRLLRRAADRLRAELSV